MTKRAAATGIRKRHSRRCATTHGGTCDCAPSWEAAVYLRREQAKIRRVFPTLAAAKSWRADATGAARRGRLRKPTSQTVREAAEQLLSGMADGSVPTRSGGRFKPSTCRSYAIALELRILPVLGEHRLSDVTRADVQDLADHLTASGLSASTVANSLDPLRVVYRRAIRRDELAVDPTGNLELRRPTGRRDRIAGPAEAARLLAALDDDDRCVYACALYAGLRRGELRALRWADIDLAGHTIHVQRSWDDREGEQGTKTAAGDRRVPILAVLSPILAEHGLRTGRTDGLVFGDSPTVPFSPPALRRRALAAWQAHNRAEHEAAASEARDVDPERLLAPISLHEGRHTTASLFIAAGANPKVVQRVMGHANIGMTLDVYAGLFPDDLDQAAARVDAYLAASAAPRDT